MFSFTSASIEPQWVKGKLAMEKDIEGSAGNSIVLIDPKTNKEEVVLTAEQMKDWAMQDWQFSPDGNKLLFVTQKNQIYRHSFLANYAVYDITKKEWFQPWGNETIEECSWSPNGDFVWVKDGNLFYSCWEWDNTSSSSSSKDENLNVEDDQTFDQRFTKTIQITHDGEYIKNGVADWIYEEEILQSSRAYYWSKNGSFLAYLKFDDEKVTKFPLTVENVDRIFTSGSDMINYINYPRPGEENPKVSLHYVKIDSCHCLRGVQA